jgi:cytochrome c553
VVQRGRAAQGALLGLLGQDAAARPSRLPAAGDQGGVPLGAHVAGGRAAVAVDVRNGVALCERCHERHTLAVRRVPRYLLPAGVFAFIHELDALAWPPRTQPLMSRLRQEYPDA